jgi:hypothetical protein
MYNQNQQYQQQQQQTGNYQNNNGGQQNYNQNQGQQQYNNAPQPNGGQQYQNNNQNQQYNNAPQNQAPQNNAPAPQAAQQNGNSVLVQGRLVWLSGRSPFEGKLKTDDNGKPIIDEKTGEQVIEYGFGLSVPKMDPRTGQQSAQFKEIMDAIYKEAYTLYPNGQLPNDFALKFKDGDGVDHKGIPFGEREGYKGCNVIACTTRIPIKFFIFSGGNNTLVNDGIKCGDYVNVQLNIKAHPAKGRGKPGLYMNPSAVQLIQAGKEIINTPSGDQMFGMNAPSYNGTIVPHVQAPMPNMNQAPQNNNSGQQHYNNNQNQQYSNAPQPNNGGQQYSNNGQAPAPHYDVLPNNGQQQNQGQQQYQNNNQNQQYNNAPQPNQGQQQYANNGQMPMPNR